MMQSHIQSMRIINQVVYFFVLIACLGFNTTPAHAAQLPFAGTAWAVPGLIEVEDYDLGGEGMAYHDTAPGNAGGQYRSDDVDIWVDASEGTFTGANKAGEWLEYTVNVASAGSYQLQLRYSTPNSNRKVHVEFNGVNVSGAMTLPNTGGWTNWQTLTVPVTLSAGQQVMRLAIDGNGMNLNWINLSSDTGTVQTPAITPNGGSYTDSVNVTLATGTSGASIYYTTNGNTPTSSSTLYTAPFTLTASATVKAIAVKNGLSDSAIAQAVFTISPSGGGGGGQSPFGGTARAIPGLIEVEDYDLGGEGMAYHDTAPGNAGGQYRSDDVDIWVDASQGTYVGANKAGEWLEYTVNVASAGSYQLQLHYTTPNSNRKVHVEFNGVNVSGAMTLPNTGGWTNWQTLTVPVTLSAGQQVMRLAIDGNGMNLNWINLSSDTGTVQTPAITPNGGSYTDSVNVTLATGTSGASIYYTTNGNTPTSSSTLYTAPFTLTASATVKAIAVKNGLSDSAIAQAVFTISPSGGGGGGQSPFGGTARAIPGLIEVEDYDLGGEGMAYHDTAPGNAGGQYRSDDVDIWVDASEGTFTGANKAGEWLEYTVNVASAGSYQLQLRYSTPNSNRKVHVEFNGVNVSGAMTLPNTGGWTNWQTLTVPVTLSAGQQVMRLAIDGNGMNLDRINLTSGGGGGGGGGGFSLPFVENFSTGAPNWTVVDETGDASNWNTSAGKYRQNAFVGFTNTAMFKGYHLGTYSYLSTATQLTDYQFSVKATPNADSGQDIGVMARLNPGSNRYARLSFSAANGFARLETRVGNVFKTLAKNARGYQKGTPLNITMEVQGPVIIAMVNGVKLFGGYDINLTQGTVGLYCRDACIYDNVNIRANDPAPMVVIADAPSFSVSTNTSFTVSAVVLNKPTGAKVKFQLNGQASACTNASDAGTPGLFTASCTATGQGTHTLKAILKDSSNITLDSDNNSSIAVGDNYVMVGDSTSVGLDDNTAGDGVSQNGMMISSMGAAAILIDKLAGQIQPSIVHKAATPGDKSSHTATSRTATITERHGDADTALVLIGINDTNGTMFTPSGLGCSGAACNGTYKGNMKSVINQLNAAGIAPVIARVAPRFGDPFKAPYTNPATHTRNLLIRDEYNVVITNQLPGRQVGPDFYDYFLGSENRFYLYATNLHPNALGYHVMAHLWWNYLSGNSTPPFIVNGLCLKLTQGGSCVSPLPYKQNLLEVGNTYYVDQGHKLTGSIPSVLNDGRWIMTRHADRNKSNSNYLSFTVPQSSTLYVAYDANASSLPGWLSNNFTTTSKFLNTSNSSAPSMRLYRQNGVVGNVTLGGAAATANGAAANYVVIVVKN